MKNKIMIVGNSNFTREAYVEGEYVVYPKNDILNQLFNNYDCLNISSPNLTTSKSINLIKAFTEKQDFDYCIVSLGKADEKIGLKDTEIENNLQIIINVLISRGIVPVLCNPANSLDETNLSIIIGKIKNKFNLNTSLKSLGLKRKFA